MTATVKRLGQIICERDPVRAAERDRLLREQQGGQVRMQLRQSLLPGVHHGLIDCDELPAGTPFPQAMGSIEPGAVPQMMDDLLPHGFLLVLRHAPDAAALRALREPAAALGAQLLCIDAAAAVPGIAMLAEADGILAAWFERHQCEGALVRPDHLVYGVARILGEVEALMQRACKTLGATPNRTRLALQEPA